MITALKEPIVPTPVLIERCTSCRKTPDFCVCEQIQPLKNKFPILILQHPQEKKKNLNSAILAHLMLEKSVLTNGLSWPNLKKALGASGFSSQPSDWGILYLGTRKQIKRKPSQKNELLFFAGNDEEPYGSESPVYEDRLSSIKGLIILDGNWKQAKTLWWRNAWVKKCQRVALMPTKRSQFGTLLREPRKECLSTLESIALGLEALGEKPEIPAQLTKVFASFLENAQKNKAKLH